MNTTQTAEAHEVRWIDYRPNGTERLISTHADENDAHDAARNIAQGAADSLGIGGTVTETPGSRLEVWHNGQHVADVMVLHLWAA